MKPSSDPEYYPEPDRPIHSVTLASSPGGNSKPNRRVSSLSGAQRFYPWLLFASTAVAAVFCFAYITKPVVINHNPVDSDGSIPRLETSTPTEQPETSVANKSTLTDSAETQAPSIASQDSAPSNTVPAAPNSNGFEETNLRMQHILDAESSTGEIHRLVIEVPVLYKSRNLRWSQQEVAQARILLQQLEQHQEQTRVLRDQGKRLLQNWNTLMTASIPDEILRADSPSLPINQRNDGFSIITPASDAVELQQNTK